MLRVEQLAFHSCYDSIGSLRSCEITNTPGDGKVNLGRRWTLGEKVQLAGLHYEPCG